MWCVIPVAGEATRLASVTRGGPKALVEVAGRPVLEHILDRLGPPFTDVCLVTGTDERPFRERFGERFGGMAVHYARQPVPLGVADAVGHAAPLVSGAFVALMGDSYYERPLTGFPLRWRETDAEGAVLVEPAGEHGGQPMGMVRVRDGLVREIFKAPWAGETDWLVSGAFLLPPSFFDVLPDTPPAASGEMELEDVVTGLMRGGARFRAIPYAGWRRNINTPRDLASVENRIAEMGSGPSS